MGRNTTFYLNSKPSAAGPAVYAAMALAAGIAAGSSIPVQWKIGALIFAAAVIIAAIVFRSCEHTVDMVLLFALAAAGGLSTGISAVIHQPLILPETYLNRTLTITGTISEEPRIYNPDAAGMIVEVDTINQYGNEFDVRGEIPVYIYRETDGLSDGARIRVSGIVKRYRTFAVKPKYTYRIVANAGDDHEALVIRESRSPLTKLRTSISAIIDRHDFGGHREIVRAVTIGDRAALPQETSAAFSQSGIAHVLAVSGLHTGIVMLVIGSLLSLLNLGRVIRAILISASLIGYAAICGFQPPVLRAAIMLGLLSAGQVLGRKGQNENTLAVALIIILAIYPDSLFGPSLQLSFAAVWGIITFHTPAMRLVTGGRRISRFLRTLVSAGILSVIAFLATAPIVAVHFGRLPLFSLAANLPAVFIIMLAVPMSWIAILATALGSFGAPVATVAAYFTGILLHLLDMIARLVSSLPFSSPEVTMPGIAAFLLVAGFAAFSRRSWDPLYIRTSIFLPMIALVIITWEPIAIARSSEGSEGSIVFFDVGQGDAALVEYRDGRRFLIDAGPRYESLDSGSDIIARYLERSGIHHLNGVFISHCHSDHTGGIAGLLSKVSADDVYCRADVADSLSTIFKRPVTGLAAGDSLAFPGGGILVMAPGASERLAENDASLLLRFTVGSSQVLFTGDIEEKRQQRLRGWGERLTTDVLKAPHHGGDLDTWFLDDVKPEIVVISCGAGNSYGHPAPEVLTRIRDSESTALRTDRDGTVRIDLPSLAVQPY